MKYLVKIFVINLIVFCINNANAENLIVYINLEKLMNQTSAGKLINNQIEKIKKNNFEEFNKIEKELKEEESTLASQKNILSNEEFSKKIDKLRIKVNNYRKDKQEKINNLNNKRLEALKLLLDQINPILSDYSKKNDISIILPKKNVVLAKTALDITDEIIKITDSKVKEINLK